MLEKEQTFDYNVEIRVRNNRILEYMKKAGIGSVAGLARVAGVCYPSLNDIVNMKVAPTHRNSGEWKSIILTVAQQLGCFAGDLFSEGQRVNTLFSNRVNIAVSEIEMPQLCATPETCYRIVYSSELKESIIGALSNLSDREAYVLKMRFGLCGYDYPRSFREIAGTLGVSGERVQQLENRGIRKLKHHSVHGNLREFVDGACSLS